MSRAFVKETDRDEVVLPPAPDLPPGAPNRITPEGARRLRRELEALRREREGLLGDDGALARARLLSVQGQVAFLEGRVATFVETAPPPAPERVSFGVEVVVADEEGEERAWHIVGVDEADPSEGRVSWVSPLARAVLGAREGDVVRLRTPRGDEELEVVAVRAP